MHDRAVVPEDQVADPPAMAVDEVRLHGVGIEHVDQRAAFDHRHPFDSQGETFVDVPFSPRLASAMIPG
jgi:hypothetical protein